MTTKTECDVCAHICGDTGMKVVLKAGVFKTKIQVFDVCDICCLQDLCQKISVGEVTVEL